MCWTRYNLFPKNLLWCTRVTALNVRVPSFAPTVGANMRLKNTWFKSPEKQLLLNIMTKINNDSVSQCLLHCLKQKKKRKYDEALVHSDGLSKRGTFLMLKITKMRKICKHGTFLMLKITKMRKICPFFFSQKICITPFINSWLQNVTVGFWVYSQPIFVMLWCVWLSQYWISVP